MLRAMLLAFPKEMRLHAIHDQYMLGDALLVKPVTRPLHAGGGITEVALPEGLWYDLFSLACRQGGGVASVPTPLETFPVFVRAGSILPMADGARCAAEATARELWVFEGRDGTLDFYDDSGDGPALSTGAYVRVPMRYDDASGSLELGAALGGTKVNTELTVRYFRKDGKRDTARVRYAGELTRVVIRN